MQSALPFAGINNVQPFAEYGINPLANRFAPIAASLPLPYLAQSQLLNSGQFPYAAAQVSGTTPLAQTPSVH